MKAHENSDKLLVFGILDFLCILTCSVNIILELLENLILVLE